MIMNLNIERLVLKDDLLDRRQGALLGEALQAELTRLLAEQETSAPSFLGRVIPVHHAKIVKPNPDAGPAEWGMQIAQAVYGAMKS
jgi:hypothetical protein